MQIAPASVAFSGADHPMTSTTVPGISRRRFSGLVAGVAALGAPSLRAQSGNRILLGQSAAFTGAAAQLGIQFHAGAKLFFDQLNGQGGVNQQRVEILQLDDGYEPDRCVENTNKLIAADVFALFGYIGTPTSVAALPLAFKADTPFFAPFTGAMGLRQPFNRLAFHLRASYNDETELIVRQLTNLGLKKIAVFHQNDAYGKAGLDGTVLALKSRNLEPVATATVERNSVDVAQAVEKINAAKPDAVVQISAYKSCAAFIKEARAKSYGGQFFNVSFVGSQALANELGPAGLGVVISQVVPFPYVASSQIVRDYQQHMTAAGDKNFDFSSMEGYLTARVLTEGLRRAGRALTRDGLIAGLESMREVNLGGFMVNYSAKNHMGSGYTDLTLIGRDGHFVR